MHRRPLVRTSTLRYERLYLPHSTVGRDETTGSHDTGDPYTTNLFLSDLHPTVREGTILETL